MSGLGSDGTNAELISQARAGNPSLIPQNNVIAQTITVAAANGAERNVTIPAGVAADYVAEQLSAELSPLGINVTSHTRVFLEMPTGIQTGNVGFDIAGKNILPVSVVTSVDNGDLTGLAEAINYRTTVTGISATLTSDSKRIVLDQPDGVDIFISDILAGSINMNVSALDANYRPLGDIEFNSNQGLAFSGTTEPIAEVAAQVAISGINYVSAEITSVESLTTIGDDGYTVAFDGGNSKVTVIGSPTGPGSLVIALKDGSNNVDTASVIIFGDETRDVLADKIDQAISAANSGVTTVTTVGSDYIAANSGPIKNVVDDVTNITIGTDRSAHVLTMNATSGSLEALIEGTVITVAAGSSLEAGAASFANAVNTNASLLAMGVKAVAANDSSGQVSLYYKNTKSLSQNTRITGQLSITSKSGFNLQSDKKLERNSLATQDANLGGLVTRNFTKAGTSASLEFAANVEIDGAATNVDGTKAQAPSAFYDVKLDAVGGAFEANISSGEVGETSSALIAAGIAEKMRLQAPVPSITGVPIASLPAIGSFARFSIGDAEYTLERDAKGLKVSGPEAGRVLINTERVYSGGVSSSGEPMLLGQSITLSVNGGSLTGRAPLPLFDDNASLFGFGAGANYSSGSDNFSPVDPKVTHKAQSVLQGRDFTVPVNGIPSMFTATIKDKAVAVTLTNNFNPIGVVIGGVTFASGAITSVKTSTGIADDGYTVAFDAIDNKVTVVGAPTGAGSLTVALTDANGHIVTADVVIAGDETRDELADEIDKAIDAATDTIANVTTADNNSGTITLTSTLAGGVSFNDISALSALSGANISLTNNDISVTSAPSVAGTISFDLLDSDGNSLAISVPFNGPDVITSDNNLGAITLSSSLAGGVSFNDIGAISPLAGADISLTSNVLNVTSAPSVAGTVAFNLVDSAGNSLAISVPVNGTESEADVATLIAGAIDTASAVPAASVATEIANAIDAAILAVTDGLTTTTTLATGMTIGTGDAYNQLTVSSTTGSTTNFAISFMGGEVSGTFLEAVEAPASGAELDARALQLAKSINADPGITNRGGSAVASTNGTGIVFIEGALSVTTDETVAVSNPNPNVLTNVLTQQARIAIDGVIFDSAAIISVKDSTNVPDKGYKVLFDAQNRKVTVAGAPTGKGSLSITLNESNGHIITALVDVVGTETQQEFTTAIETAIDEATDAIANLQTALSSNTNASGQVVDATVSLSGGQAFVDIPSINGPGGGSIKLLSNDIIVTNTPTSPGNITFNLIDTKGNSLAISVAVTAAEPNVTVANRIKIAIEAAREVASDGLTTTTELLTDRITLAPSNEPDATIIIEGVTVTAYDIEQARYTFGADGFLTNITADITKQRNNYANRFAQVINENADLVALGLSAVPTVDGTGDVFVNRLSVSLTPASGSKAIQLKADLTNGPIQVMGGASATTLGFKVAEADLLVTDAGLTAASLNGLPVDLSGSGTSLAKTRMQLTGLPAEELIVVVADGGSRRISAKYTIDADITVDPLKKEQQYQVKMLDVNTGRVELFDKATGHSIATRISNGNAQFDADGLRFNLNGYAATGDSFDVLTGQKSAGDARNMDEIMSLATSTVGRSSFQDDFRSIAASVGSTLQSSRLSKLSAEAVRDAAVAAEDSVSGVNMDEEAAKLITQQQAYQAAARILQTAKEMFDTLMQIR